VLIEAAGLEAGDVNQVLDRGRLAALPRQGANRRVDHGDGAGPSGCALLASVAMARSKFCSVIDPRDSRKVLSQAPAACYNHMPKTDVGQGVFRM
jgi:hypothetical protein